MLPSSITVGESFDWRDELPDYPVADGWAVAYHFRGPSVLNVTGAGSGDEWAFTVTPAQSGAVSPGRYDYQAFATKGADAKKLVASGSIEFKASLATATAGYDGRSTYEQTLAAIENALKGIGGDAVQSYVITTPHGTREIRNYSLAELTDLHKYFTGLVSAERNRKSGKATIGHTFYSFGKPQ